MKYQNIVFSGLPGAGKSTLVKKISEFYGWPVHSIGEIWRQRWAAAYPNKELSFEEYWSKSPREDQMRINIEAREIFTQSKIIGDIRYTIYLRDLPIFLVFMSADLETRATRGFGLENTAANRLKR